MEYQELIKLAAAGFPLKKGTNYSTSTEGGFEYKGNWYTTPTDEEIEQWKKLINSK